MSLPWVIFVGTPSAVLLLWLLTEFWPRTPEQLYEKRLRELQDDMRRRGLTPQQKQQEMSFRYAMARLRRKASAAAKANPPAAIDRIRESAAYEAEMISDRSVKRRFLEIATAGPIDDVLYRDALRAVRKYERARAAKLPRVKITEDDIAAVTTERRW